MEFDFDSFKETFIENPIFAIFGIAAGVIGFFVSKPFYKQYVENGNAGFGMVITGITIIACAVAGFFIAKRISEK